MLGAVKHFADELLKKDQVGVATGLAWTSVGGDILFVEALAVRGKGGLRLTGQLGDVMKESAQAAMSYARAHGGELGIPADFFETHDVHVHVPEGSIPKDGPSHGITFRYVENVEEVLEIALLPYEPEPVEPEAERPGPPPPPEGREIPVEPGERPTRPAQPIARAGRK